MSILYRPAQSADLTQIMAIENAGFTPDEAATKAAMQARIQAYPDTFVVAAEGAKVLGYVVGPAIDERYLSDDLFVDAVANPATAAYQSILSLAVAPSAQKRGLGSALLQQLADVARGQQRKALTLTCLERLLPFYIANGYVNEGVAASTHAGEVWYNCVFTL